MEGDDIFDCCAGWKVELCVFGTAHCCKLAGGVGAGVGGTSFVCTFVTGGSMIASTTIGCEAQRSMTVRFSVAAVHAPAKGNGQVP